MKVLAILILAVSSASARGSGPYLPSGWRPDGPAFFLPGEGTTKTSDNPLKETLFQETEASGSDFLREYGPPKVQEVSQDITQQGLPDVATEQSFVVIGAKITQEVEDEVKTGEVTETEAVVVAEEQTKNEEVTTEAQINVEEGTTEQSNEELIQGRAIKLEIEASVADTTEDFVEAAVVTESGLIKQEISEAEAKVEKNIVSNVVKDVAEALTDVEQNVNILEEVKNVAQGIVKIESEIAQEQAVEGSGVRSVQITDSIEHAPEGFLEYGPPGFREYGPPKGDEVLRSSAVQEESESQKVESNETRRRRFSPKFKSTKKH
ncbi:uncharacterized protein LOC128681088 [Plodia interpunctella]|uniref:uncharacterized protein LOC128681088 n=1 Tax=Plodia interpunctella TaxID=58824 RepID=UPI0023683721|nr:uncharacterized protein LOC128681088 [Plodia interpunctella]